MEKNVTPLRYPGGKTKLYNYTKSLIEYNNLVGCAYIEPYAGGSGLALKLLINNIVSKIILNDINYNLYCFWNSALYHTDSLIAKIEITDICIEEWYRQKNIFNNIDTYSELDVGFATLYLNRTNFSGILNAGPLGGKKQNSKYKIDCRFNKDKIIKLVKNIGTNSEKIEFLNMDALDFLDYIKQNKITNSLTFIDPPYYVKGQDLYINYYNHNDHENLRDKLISLDFNWILTYDYAKEIQDLYSNFDYETYSLNYSANKVKQGQEIMVYSNNIKKLEFK